MVARLAIFPALDASQEANLVAAASLSGPVPAPWDRYTVADYDAVIDHPDVEAVYIPLPNDLHLRWALRAAEAGKHVLCEKPLEINVERVDAMIAAAQKNQKILAAVFQSRFGRGAQTLKHAITREIRSADPVQCLRQMVAHQAILQ